MKENKICEKCENCIYIGEGDFICDNTEKVIKENWIPTCYYGKCNLRGD